MLFTTPTNPVNCGGGGVSRTRICHRTEKKPVNGAVTTTLSTDCLQTCCLDKGDRVMSGSVRVVTTPVSTREVEQQHSLKKRFLIFVGDIKAVSNGNK